MPDYVWQSDPLTFWRERILFVICFVAAAFGPLVLVPSIWLAYTEGLWNVFGLDLMAYFAAVGILLGRGLWLSLEIRALGACLVLYLLGTGLLFILGPFGAGYIWLFGASVLMSAIIGIQVALLTLLLNLMALVAVGGEVNIDVSAVPGDPQATIKKAEAIRKAALAPANPSAQDRRVAARAMQMKMTARAEQQQQEAGGNDRPPDTGENNAVSGPGQAPVRVNVFA